MTRTVEQWVRHVETSPVGTPGCYVAGGGPPPPRSTMGGHAGFWVSTGEPAMYAFVPDEIAAQDTTGKYRAGMMSPGCPEAHRKTETM